MNHKSHEVNAMGVTITGLCGIYRKVRQFEASPGGLK
jgi:hypothetical protein